MSEQPTLRTHLDAIRVALTIGERLRADQHAVAALNLLDAAKIIGGRTKPVHRLILDPPDLCGLLLASLELSCPEVPAETRDGETT